MGKLIKVAMVIVFVLTAVCTASAEQQILALNTKTEIPEIKSAVIKCERKNDDMSKCLTCHEKNGWKQMKYVHGPIAMNECRPCHIKPQNVKTKKATLMLSRVPCLFCHQAEEIKSVHPEEIDQQNPDCFGCHDPHASNEKYFLR